MFRPDSFAVSEPRLVSPKNGFQNRRIQITLVAIQYLQCSFTVAEDNDVVIHKIILNRSAV